MSLVSDYDIKNLSKQINRSEAQQKADNGDPKANLEDRIWRKPQMLKFSHRQVAELYCRVKPNWSLVDRVSGTPLR
jgi:hypothetical protein